MSVARCGHGTPLHHYCAGCSAMLRAISGLQPAQPDPPRCAIHDRFEPCHACREDAGLRRWRNLSLSWSILHDEHGE